MNSGTFSEDTQFFAIIVKDATPTCRNFFSHCLPSLFPSKPLFRKITIDCDMNQYKRTFDLLVKRPFLSKEVEPV